MTQEELETYLKKYFTYDAKSGKMNRTDRRNSNGSFDKDGYLILKVKGKQYKAHRIAWFLYYGKFPENVIDHINRKKSDNRIVNLRDVDQEINVKNTEGVVNKDTGVVGVHFDKTKGLKKNFAVKYKNNSYRFYTLNEAIEFRKEKGLKTTKEIK